MNAALLLPMLPAATPSASLLDDLLARSAEAPAAIGNLATGDLAHPAPAEPTEVETATLDPTLATAAALLEQGQVQAAQHLLRHMPRRGACRAEAVRLSVAAAGLDPEFRNLVHQADEARDRQAWGEAEYIYWRALAFYPLHSGYVVQYGHALKEQCVIRWIVITDSV